MLSIAHLTRPEKLQMMEALWSDLSRDEKNFSSPDWHTTALQQAERAMTQGRATLHDWNEAKESLRKGST
jgi:hypothetical protein